MRKNLIAPVNPVSDSEDKIPPFLKWAGGKRWLVAQYVHLIPTDFRRYIEPFLGGGSVFFHLKPERAILSDLNADLIAAYQAIKDHAKAVREELTVHQEKHGEDYYYQIRGAASDSKIAEASRFIYLNRTCFNGIYRVNLKGVFNVPKGTKSAVVLDTDDFEAMACLLAKARLLACDFEEVIAKAGRGDFVFADPPYTVRHNVNGFVKYNEKLFSWEDQKRLVVALTRAKSRGAQILATNANHQSVRDLYREAGFNPQIVSRYSAISADAGSRRQFEELIVRS